MVVWLKPCESRSSPGFTPKNPAAHAAGFFLCAARRRRADQRSAPTARIRSGHGRIRSGHSRIRAGHAVGSVPKRPPITVIGTVTHEPTPKPARLRSWSCPNGVITTPAVDWNATLPGSSAQAPTGRIRAGHAVGSVPKRPPMTVIGTETHGPTPKTASLRSWSCPNGVITTPAVDWNATYRHRLTGRLRLPGYNRSRGGRTL